jgi:hypothetical protein
VFVPEENGEVRQYEITHVIRADTFPPKPVESSILERFPFGGISIPKRFLPVTSEALASPSLGTELEQKARYE